MFKKIILKTLLKKKSQMKKTKKLKIKIIIII